jgi:hypothetical protein
MESVTTYYGQDHLEVDVSFGKRVKTIATDSHFLIPLCVLVLGIALLAALH